MLKVWGYIHMYNVDVHVRIVEFAILATIIHSMLRSMCCTCILHLHVVSTKTTCGSL